MDSKKTNFSENNSSLPSTEETASQTFNQSLTNNEPPKKNKKWKKILIIANLVIIAVPVLGFLLLSISFSGGIDGILSNLKSAPSPESSNIVSKRNSAINSINNSFTELDAKTGFTNYAESNHDRCYEGQNNWKRKDGYAHRCTYRTTRFYGFNSDFRSEMINFEKTIYELGWSPPQWQDDQFPMKDILEGYYDKYYGPDKPQTRNFPNGYFVSSLPSPNGYERVNGILEIEYAERASTDLFQIEYAQNISRDTLFETYDKKDFENLQSVFQEITRDNNFVLTISIQEDYFQN